MSDSQQTSGPLADADVNAIKECLVVTAVLFVIHGLYTALVISAVHKLISRRGLRNSTARKLLLTVTLTMFATTTTIVISQLFNYLLQMPSLGYNPPDNSLLLRRLVVVSSCFIRLNYVISDSIVVWRSWIIWSDSIIARLVLTICMLGTLASTFTDGAYVVLLDIGQPSLQQIPRALILGVPLLFTNLVATSLVAYKAWTYRREIQSNASHFSRSSLVQNLLVLLVESGFLYCFFWVIWLVTQFVSDESKATTFYVVISLSLPLISGIYPTAIVLLVAHQRDQQDRLGNSVPQSIIFMGRTPSHSAKEIHSPTSEDNRHRAQFPQDTFALDTYGPMTDSHGTFSDSILDGKRFLDSR